jgi:hypothetical protein
MEFAVCADKSTKQRQLILPIVMAKIHGAIDCHGRKTYHNGLDLCHVFLENTRQSL